MWQQLVLIAFFMFSIYLTYRANRRENFETPIVFVVVTTYVALILVVLSIPTY